MLSVDRKQQVGSCVFDFLCLISLFLSSRAHRVALEIQSGLVWVNCWMVRDLRVPFGGWKESGIGREGGKFALEFYTEQKNVTMFYGQ